ncbi:UDP-3-O-acyl-N-acetylglucosamine deacetylase [Terrarubrum flagellatum]|uniref:UDP-3-O-acyl-N-acetylglucosamine deacetylase n=1 Tax=Terrirubrum flagellatum TaxID=2895980 RepID=UPI00314522EC
MGLKQTTIKGRVEVTGVGVHSGAPAKLVLHPAEAGHGVIFQRTGLAGGRDRLIEASHRHVSATELCTVIGDRSTGAVSTIEHLMSALMGLGVDNVFIEVDGPEIPIMDGSAWPFVEAIMSVGVATLSAKRRYIKVLKPVRVDHERSFCELRPAEQGFSLDVEIDFPLPTIGRQRRAVTLDSGVFVREVARARTFGLLSDVERLWKANLALGASLENTVAVDETRVVNPEGLRYPDEFVRHKLLDAIGDLALAGAPMIGKFRSYRGGHRMNFLMLQALFADRNAYALVDAPAASRPAAAAASAADLTPAMASPVFAADRN